MRNRFVGVSALALAVVMGGCTVIETVPSSTTSAYVQDVAAIRAQDDFYGYINASYLMELDVSDSQGFRSRFGEINSVIDDRLDELIRGIAAGDRESYPAGSNEQLIYDLYYQVLDASTSGSLMTSDDMASFSATCDRILSISSVPEYLSMVGELYRDFGVNPVFSPYVIGDESVVVLPFVNPTSEELEFISLGGSSAQSTANYYTTVLVEAGVDPEEAAARGVADANLLMDIAAGTDFDLEKTILEDTNDIQNYLIYKSYSEIDSLCPNVGHEGILTTMGFDSSSMSGLYIVEEEQLSTVDSLMTSENLEGWKDILLVSYQYSLIDMLPLSYGGPGTVYTNDEYALAAVKRKLSLELGEEYVEVYYDEATVSAVTSIAYAVRDEYVSLIADCSWMSDEGKALVTDKLMSMTFCIGAAEPHEVDPSAASLIGPTCYETAINMNRKRHDRNKDSVDGSLEESGFDHMPPQTVNACYVGLENTMVIPLGIMDAPFYDPDASYYANLGGIGAVIGHEISHAFDYSGMQYDASGNFDPDWMPASDIEAFASVSSSFVEYYSSYTVMTYHNVDGDLTITENMADAAGLECVLRLAPSLSEKQEIFENYAKIFASVTTREAMLDQIATDAHSPDMVRINANVALFDEFYEIYDVNEGDLMYVAPSDRVRRW